MDTVNEATNSSSPSAKHLVILLLLTALLVGGCRMRSPGVEEQQTMADDGLFPRGTPAWASLASTNTRSAGIIPESYSASPLARALSPGASARTESFNTFARADSDRRTSDSYDRSIKRSSSAMARVTTLCPTVEQSVTDALTTVDRDKRITKYRRLLQRCPTSPDLWFWIGKDYQAAGRNLQAADAFRETRRLDPTNTEAAARLAEVEK